MYSEDVYSVLNCYNSKTSTADKAYTQETTKLTKKNSTEKHKWKRAECDHVEKRQKPTKQIPSGIPK
jgi:hypothetical protein